LNRGDNNRDQAPNLSSSLFQLSSKCKFVRYKYQEIQGQLNVRKVKNLPEELDRHPSTLQIELIPLMVPCEGSYHACWLVVLVLFEELLLEKYRQNHV